MTMSIAKQIPAQCSLALEAAVQAYLGYSTCTEYFRTEVHNALTTIKPRSVCNETIVEWDIDHSHS